MFILQMAPKRKFLNQYGGDTQKEFWKQTNDRNSHGHDHDHQLQFMGLHVDPALLSFRLFLCISI
jgi:hypothetical protein